MTTASIKATFSSADFRRRFLIFLLPGLYQSALPFLTLPLTTLILGPADFALFSITNAMLALLVTLSQLGSVFTLAHRFTSTAGDDRRRLVSTITIQVLILSTIFATLLFTLWPLVREYWSVAAKVTMPMIALVSIAMVGMSLYTLARTLAIYGHRPGYCSLMTMVEASMSVAATLAGLFIFHLHVVSLFLGQFAAGMVDLIGSLLLFLPFLTWRYDRNVARDCLRLGGWNSFAHLTMQGRQILERGVLSTSAGLHDLGLFVHAQQYQNYVMLGARPIQQAMTPVMLDEARTDVTGFVRTGRVSQVLFLVITMFAFTFAFLGREIISVLTHGKFDDAAPYAGLLIGVLLLQFAGRPQYARLLSQGRGRYLSISNVIAVAGAALVLVMLVPYFGIPAAVAAIYIQFALYRLLIEIDAWRGESHPPFHDLSPLISLALLGGAVTIVALWHPGFWLRVALLSAWFAMAGAINRMAIRDALEQTWQVWTVLTGPKTTVTPSWRGPGQKA